MPINANDLVNLKATDVSSYKLEGEHVVKKGFFEKIADGFVNFFKGMTESGRKDIERNNYKILSAMTREIDKSSEDKSIDHSNDIQVKNTIANIKANIRGVLNKEFVSNCFTENLSKVNLNPPLSANELKIIDKLGDFFAKITTNKNYTESHIAKITEQLSKYGNKTNERTDFLWSLASSCNSRGFCDEHVERALGINLINNARGNLTAEEKTQAYSEETLNSKIDELLKNIELEDVKLSGKTYNSVEDFKEKLLSMVGNSKKNLVPFILSLLNTQNLKKLNSKILRAQKLTDSERLFSKTKDIRDQLNDVSKAKTRLSIDLGDGKLICKTTTTNKVYQDKGYGADTPALFDFNSKVTMLVHLDRTNEYGLNADNFFAGNKENNVPDVYMIPNGMFVTFPD